MVRKMALMGLLLVLLLGMAGCTAGPNSQVDAPNVEGEVAGFWSGLWHGVVAPVTFVISLFNQNVGMYEIHNNGGWYNFGFLLGLTAIWGGGGAASRRRWHWKHVD